jgi:hypothetical protein
MIRLALAPVIVLVSFLTQNLILRAEYQDKPQEPAATAPATTEPATTEPPATPAVQEPAPASVASESKSQESKPAPETDKRLEAIEKLLEQLSGELKARKRPRIKNLKHHRT